MNKTNVSVCRLFSLFFFLIAFAHRSTSWEEKKIWRGIIYWAHTPQVSLSRVRRASFICAVKVSSPFSWSWHCVCPPGRKVTHFRPKRAHISLFGCCVFWNCAGRTSTDSGLARGWLWLGWTGALMTAEGGIPFAAAVLVNKFFNAKQRSKL